MMIYLGLFIFMSLMTYLTYYDDKRKSIKGKWRTKEKTLLLLSLSFGSLGGLIAMYQFRHKTKHWYFFAINWGSLLIHMMIGYFIYLEYPLFL